MPGPHPAEPGHRQRRNTVSTAGVIDAEVAQKPPLGRSRPDRGPAGKAVTWHAMTRRWWDAVWGSAIAERWIDAHVPGLFALARMVDDYWRASDPVVAKQIHAEVRMAEREYGLTPMAARGLNWEFRRPQLPPDKAEPLPPGADPRKVLTMDHRRRSAG